MNGFKKFIIEDKENQLGVPMNEKAIVAAVESEIQKQMDLHVKLTSTLKLDASSNDAFKDLDVTRQIGSKIFSQVALTFSSAMPSGKSANFVVIVGTRIKMSGENRYINSDFMEVYFDADGKNVKSYKY